MDRTRVRYQDISSFIDGKTSLFQTLCEPLLQGTSFILSPFHLQFKVKVINDQHGGLVRMFELFRCEPFLVKKILDISMQRNGEPLPAIPLEIEKMINIHHLTSISPFIKTRDDILVALNALKTCILNLHLDNDAYSPNLWQGNIMATIHKYLEPVLIEKMDPALIVQRFNRAYTVFYIPSNFIFSIQNAREFIDNLKNVKGLIIFERMENHSNDIASLLAGFSTIWSAELLTSSGNHVFRSLDCSVPRA